MNSSPTPPRAFDPARRAGRRRRIERELKALHAFESQHRQVDLLWAVATIGGLGALWLAALLKFNGLSGSWLLAVPASLALGTAVWAIGRRWFTLAFLIVAGLLILVFEDVPDLGDWSGDDEAKSKKERRRAKLQAAIAKREALLERL